MSAPWGIAPGPDGALWFTNYAGRSIGRITTAGVVSDFPAPATRHPQGITAGTDGNMYFDDTNSIWRITPAGVVTKDPDANVVIPPETAGPDGALWSLGANNSIESTTTADSVTTSPAEGPTGTGVTITGAGFNAGETINVKYDTSQTSNPAVLLCTTVAASDGTFTCTTTVPAGAGRPGTHTIKAKGTTSRTVAKTIFLRTT